MFGGRGSRRQDQTSRRRGAVRPTVEGLEGRYLLYATVGGQWAKPIRITYSFVPDGTLIGGVPSNLQATFDAKFGVGVWKEQFARAAAVWQKVARINFAQVADNGAAIGVAGNQQSDSRFGDIRIGGFAQPSNQLAFAYLPPPLNGGTNAGDIFFNTALSWQTNGTTFDLLTVAIHEFGHALGMHHSTDSSAVLWPAYTGTKQVLVTDDISGIRTIYNARQNDYFDANGSNNVSLQSDNINAYMDTLGQITLSALDSTTPLMIASGDNDWFTVTAPASTTGTMVVRMQSKHLSVLSPYVAVYNAAGTTRLGEQSSLAHGDIVTVTISGVTAGQSFKILARGATTGNSGYGGYALQVNFGSSPLPPVTLPNTTVGQSADQGGGTLSEEASHSEHVEIPSPITTIGDPGHFWVYDDWDTEGLLEEVSANLDTSPTNPEAVSSLIRVGKLSGHGHALLIAGQSGQDEVHWSDPPIIDLTPSAITTPPPDRPVPRGPLGILTGRAGLRAEHLAQLPTILPAQEADDGLARLLRARQERRALARTHAVDRVFDG